MRLAVELASNPEFSQNSLQLCSWHAAEAINKRLKSAKQLALESQKRRDTTIKANNKARRQAAIERRHTKAMKPRKEDVSQLADDLSILDSQPLNG